MNILDLSTEGIPVLDAFVCASAISGISIQKLKFGKLNDNGTRENDHFELLSSSYIKKTTTNSLMAGDWTKGEVWPCFTFEPSKSDYLRFRAGTFDQIIILVETQSSLTVFDNLELLFGLFNEERNISVVAPFVSPLPTINTFTFSHFEMVDIYNEKHNYFTINKQTANRVIGGFNVTNLMARFLYSPDSYFVLNYTGKKPFSIFEIIGAAGGLITYALGTYWVLFGRGTYRSWGIIQRYLLRNSPDLNQPKGEMDSSPLSLIESQSINASSSITPTSAASTFYFGIKGESNYINSPPINSPISNYDKELLKKIDSLINDKLWLIEQTLSRHYLSGFRLRSYDTTNAFLDGHVKVNMKNDKNNVNEELIHISTEINEIEVISDTNITIGPVPPAKYKK
ncbi:3523_t:CDS:2 [Funneliformis caledonium]|uniref:3523_t:CDS:1 n=1 Tax=Funneliformis caledonium TaxID=1117310 RepID=A0A9N9DI64_9GLOM|nr:3523_t:CDS:2 [Funneliformis caledonium]